MAQQWLISPTGVRQPSECGPDISPWRRACCRAGRGCFGAPLARARRLRRRRHAASSATLGSPTPRPISARHASLCRQAQRLVLKEDRCQPRQRSPPTQQVILRRSPLRRSLMGALLRWGSPATYASIEMRNWSTAPVSRTSAHRHERTSSACGASGMRYMTLPRTSPTRRATKAPPVVTHP
jgi:hypothetical protein